MTGTWVQAKGVKRENKLSREMAADAGMHRRDQGRAVKDGGWWVQATSGWAELCTGRRGVEQVKNKRDSTMNGYGWGGGRK